MLNSTNLSNPWTTLTVRTVYDNAWIKVEENEVIQPKGAHGIYGVVHFKNKAIGVLPIDENGFVYLIGQYRYPLHSYSWEIPEGGCSEFEEPLSAAKRELVEETGLVATYWQEIGRAHLSNSVTDELSILYLAKELSQGIAEPEETEELAVKHVPFETALDMVLKGEITDAMSVMAIMRYAWLIQSEK